MTSKEAAGKWCPMARANDGAKCSVNRADRKEPDPDCFCIADKCAVWIVDSQWGDEGQNLPQDQWQGHCGLAR